MNPRLLLLPCLLCFVFPGGAGAREIWLKKGETYRDRDRDRDLAVTCEGRPPVDSLQPLAVRECQYWDDFTKKCLFEKTTYSHNNLECVEECQHWDAFNSTCDYQSKCTFYPDQEAFVLSTCAEFDDFSHKCLRLKEEKISASR